MEDEGEYGAALEALDTIKTTLMKHWMGLGPKAEGAPTSEMPTDEPAAASIEIEVDGDPSADIENESPPMEGADGSVDPEPLSVTSFMGRGAPPSKGPPPTPPQEMKRKRGRPPKVR